MPWTIYKYILLEILKTLLPCVLVLLAIISFAASVGPLSSGFISAESVPLFIFYMAPSMLQFALPFAAAFAATIVFNRLANDNEILACRALGISYAKILMPVAAIGLSLTIGMVFLSNWVVPEFVLRAEKMATKDITLSLVNQIKQGREFVFDDKFTVFARDAVSVPAPEKTKNEKMQASQLIKLKNIVFGQLNEENELFQYGTAEQADFYVYRSDRGAWLEMLFKGVNIVEQGSGVMRFAEGENFVVPLPNFFKDQPRFLTIKQLRDIEKTPELYDRVRKRKLTLAKEAARQRVYEIVSQAVDAGGPIVLLMPDRVGKYVIQNATLAGVGGQGLRIKGREGKPLRIQFTRGGLVLKTFSSTRGATLGVKFNAMQRMFDEFKTEQAEPQIVVTLKDVLIENVAAGLKNMKKQHVETGLRVDEKVFDYFHQQLGAHQLSEQVTQKYSGIPAIQQKSQSLEHLLITMYRRIKGEQNLRIATAFSCALILILGCLFCMKDQQQMPLMIYLKTFILTLLVLILTHRGLRMATDPKASSALMGLCVLWLGNVITVLLIWFTYWKISRN